MFLVKPDETAARPSLTRAWLKFQGERVLPRDLRCARKLVDGFMFEVTSDTGGALTLGPAREVLEAAFACAFRDHCRDYLRDVRERRLAAREKSMARAGGSS